MPIHYDRILMTVLSLAGLCLAPRLFAAAGVIQIEGGKTIRGEIRTDSNAGLVVEPPGGPVVRVPFAELRFVKLGTDAQGSHNETGAQPKALPDPWVSTDVGPLRPPGETVLNGDSIVVRASGTNVWAGGRDQCRFVFQKIKGDGSIMARLDQTEARWAGVMIRKDTSADSEFVMAALNGPSGGLTFCARRSREYREKFKSEGDHHQRSELKPPLWIRLDRTAKKFTACVSRDNRANWEQVASSRGRLATEVCFGVFVSGGALDRCREATFSQVTVIPATEPHPDPRGEPGGPSEWTGSESRFDQYVLLRNGSVLKGKILELDPSAVRLTFLGQEHLFSSIHVARVVWRPAPQGTGLLLPGRNGVLLSSGDFLEGELVSVKKNDLTINSVLLGQRKVDVGSKVVALVWNDLAPDSARFLVRLRDGSVLRAPWLTSEEDAIVAHDIAASALRLPLATLAEIQRE